MKPLPCALAGLALVLLAGCGGGGSGSSSSASPATPVTVFQYTSSDEMDRSRDGFVDGMKAAGFEDGKNVKYTFENAQNDLTTATLVAKKIAQSDAKLVVPIGTPCLQTVIASIKDRPVVFTTIANPYILGVGDAADKHLPNVTGVETPSPILETMELMLQADPSVKRLGIVQDPSNANSQFNVERARKAADKLHLTIDIVTISQSSEVLQAAQTLVGRKVDVLFYAPDHVVRESSDSLVKTADQSQVPLVGSLPKLAEEGAALGVGFDYHDCGVQGAALAARVLKGESPAGIPIEGVKGRKIVVNKSAAKRQGFPLPDAVVKKATKVVE